MVCVMHGPEPYTSSWYCTLYSAYLVFRFLEVPEFSFYPSIASTGLARANDSLETGSGSG